MTKVRNLYHNGTKQVYAYYAPIIERTHKLQLNEANNYWAYLDNLLIGQLICASNSKIILDLGCYSGVMPLLVEDIIIQNASGHETNLEWILVDNFSYMKYIKRRINTSNLDLLSKGWDSIKSIFPWAENLEIPPTNPTELRDFLTAMNAQVAAPLPKMKIYESLLEVTQIIDLASFDLQADDFDGNLKALEYVNSILRDGGIIVMDDVKTMHPNQMALFITIVNSDMGLHPMAFGRGKVALIKSSLETLDEKKQAIFKNLVTAFDEPVFNWNIFHNPVFGECIGLHFAR